MALNQLIKNPTLLESLQELNELVKALQSGELTEVLADIKAKTEKLKKAEQDADASGEANSQSIAALEETTIENNQAAAAARKQREALAAEKQEADKQLQKILVAQNALDASRKDLESRTASTIADIEQKSQNLALREKKLADGIVATGAIRKEYEEKLNKLKTITG